MLQPVGSRYKSVSLWRNNKGYNRLVHRLVAEAFIPNPENKEAMETIFNEELSRLKTDYIDYYLMHMLTDVDTWQRLVDMGILGWLEEKKVKGQIRQIGFSYHGNSSISD